MNPIKITIAPEVRAFNREVQAADQMLEYKFDDQPVEVLVQQLNIAEMPAHANCLLIASAKLAITVKIRFYDEEDKRHFLKYVYMAKEREGTVTGLYCGIMCAALRRSELLNHSPELVEAAKNAVKLGNA